MILLGIDPGFADMGFGVLDYSGGKVRCISYGSIRTAAGEPAEKRLAHVYEKLDALISKYKPGAAGIEKLFFSNNAKTAMQVAEARGVIRVCLERSGVATSEFAPAAIKIAVCGHGAATKPDMQKMVKLLLGLKTVPKPDDAADALAIALTLAYTRVPGQSERVTP
ncbi:MAG: hypothetical protein RLZZ324_35 [Candidatus Parcubacteria bacterium]|jgi:crossover junction endodeoxyribonuclease RuvC